MHTTATHNVIGSEHGHDPVCVNCEWVKPREKNNTRHYVEGDVEICGDCGCFLTAVDSDEYGCEWEASEGECEECRGECGQLVAWGPQEKWMPCATCMPLVSSEPSFYGHEDYA